jgi:hypothetical protein
MNAARVSSQYLRRLSPHAGMERAMTSTRTAVRRRFLIAFAALAFAALARGGTTHAAGAARATYAPAATTGVVYGVTEIRLVDTQKTDPSSILNPVVFVTRTGTHYHRGGCMYLRLSCSPLRLAEAVAAGYTPCSRCKPPQ